MRTCAPHSLLTLQLDLVDGDQRPLRLANGETTARGSEGAGTGAGHDAPCFTLDHLQDVVGATLIPLRGKGVVSTGEATETATFEWERLPTPHPGRVHVCVRAPSSMGCYELQVAAKRPLAEPLGGPRLLLSVVDPAVCEFHRTRRLGAAQKLPRSFHFTTSSPSSRLRCWGLGQPAAPGVDSATMTVCESAERWAAEDVTRHIVGWDDLRQNGAFWGALAAGSSGGARRADGGEVAVDGRGGECGGVDYSDGGGFILSFSFDEARDPHLRTLVSHARSVTADIPDQYPVARARSLALLVSASIGTPLWQP